MCHWSVDRVPWFIFIAYLSYSPPRGELRCLPIEDLTVLSPRGELTVSSWRYWLPPYGDLDYLLVDILLFSSWRYWLPPHWLLVNNYCILVDNFIFWPASNVMIKLLAFFLPEDLLRHSFCLQCVFFVVLYNVPLGTISLGGANVTVGLRCRSYDWTSWVFANSLWCFVFFVLVLCLVATFIVQLLYCPLPKLGSCFYCLIL